MSDTCVFVAIKITVLTFLFWGVSWLSDSWSQFDHRIKTRMTIYFIITKNVITVSTS